MATGQLNGSTINGVSVATWLAAFTHPILKIATYAEIWTGLSPYNSFFGSSQYKLAGPLPVVAGQVTIDRTNAIRRTATNVTMLEDGAGSLMPVALGQAGLFSPYGHELRLFKGYRIPGVTGAKASFTGGAVTVPTTFTTGTNNLFNYTPVGGAYAISFAITTGTTCTTAAQMAAAMLAATALFTGIPFSNYCNVTVSGTHLIVSSLANGTAQDGDAITSGAHDALPALGISSGSVLAGGTQDTVVAQLGTFLIEEVDVKEDATGLTLVGTLKDRAQWIKRRGFQSAYSTDPTKTADVQILALLEYLVNTQTVYGGTLPFPYTLNATTYLPGTSHYNIADDPWQACCDIAASAGMQLYFDYSGTLILEVIPDQTVTTPCVTYTEGTTIAPDTLNRAISNAQVPNIICVVGQGSNVNPPIQAFWWDSVSTSKTYFAPAPSPYGFTPAHPTTVLAAQDVNALYPAMIQKFTTPLAASAAQAQAIAMAIGLIAIGSTEKTAFTLRDQPAHDADDVILVQRVKSGIPASTPYVIDAVVVDLTPMNPVNLTTRLVV